MLKKPLHEVKNMSPLEKIDYQKALNRARQKKFADAHIEQERLRKKIAIQKLRLDNPLKYKEFNKIYIQKHRDKIKDLKYAILNKLLPPHNTPIIDFSPTLDIPIVVKKKAVKKNFPTNFDLHVIHEDDHDHPIENVLEPIISNPPICKNNPPDHTKKTSTRSFNKNIVSKNKK
jgi:hypothetical protein